MGVNGCCLFPLPETFCFKLLNVLVVLCSLVSPFPFLPILSLLISLSRLFVLVCEVLEMLGWWVLVGFWV